MITLHQVRKVDLQLVPPEIVNDALWDSHLCESWCARLANGEPAGIEVLVNRTTGRASVATALSTLTLSLASDEHASVAVCRALPIMLVEYILRGNPEGGEG